MNVVVVLFQQVSRPIALRANASRMITHRIRSALRKTEADVTEMPMPVKTAAYVARHIGHLGSRISVALGMIHPASPAPRRHRDAGRTEPLRSQSAA